MGGGMAIADDDFKILLDTLEKSSNRTRSVYYVFAIVYISITLFAVDAFMFPFPDERLNRIQFFVDECQDPKMLQDAHCRNLATGFKLKKTTLPTGSGHLSVFTHSGLQHRRNTYLDEIATSRKFTFPLFGVSVDRDYFWLMNSLIGLVVYFVLLSALANEAHLFRFMVAAAGNNNARLQIVLASQVLSSPSDQNEDAPIPYTLSYTLVKRFLLQSVILLPIAVGLLWICDDLYLTNIVREHFSAASFAEAGTGIQDDFNYGPVIFITGLIVQVASIAVMLHGFRKIKANLSEIHDDYQTGHNKLRAAVASNVAASVPAATGSS